MSMTVGSLATAQSLVFGPSRIDVAWDGVSNGKISLLPVCSNTNQTATYSVKVLHVFPESVQKVLYSGGSSFTYTATAGEPYKTQNTSPYVTAAPFVIGSTLSTATGIVEFELAPSDSRYTGTFDYPGLHATMTPAYYRLTIEQSKGTAVQTVAAGKLTRVPPNPFASLNAVGNLVAAQTASFCIG